MGRCRRRHIRQPKYGQYAKLEWLLENARRDAIEYGCAHLPEESLDAMARAARALREELRATRVRLYVLVDEVAEHGIAISSDFLPESLARVGCSRSQVGGSSETPEDSGNHPDPKSI